MLTNMTEEEDLLNILPLQVDEKTLDIFAQKVTDPRKTFLQFQKEMNRTICGLLGECVTFSTTVYTNDGYGTLSSNERTIVGYVFSGFGTLSYLPLSSDAIAQFEMNVTFETFLILDEDRPVYPGNERFQIKIPILSNEILSITTTVSSNVLSRNFMPISIFREIKCFDIPNDLKQIVNDTKKFFCSSEYETLYTNVVNDIFTIENEEMDID